MNPQQPFYGNGPTLPTPGPEQYDFIMNSNSPNQRLQIANSVSTKTRILIALGAGIVLLMLVWAFLSFLSRATSTDTSSILSLAEQQNELSRISANPSQQAFAQSTQNFAATMELSLITEQQAFLKFLETHGVNPSIQTLASTANPKTDSSLKEAQSTGNYDQAYISITQSELAAYEQGLKNAYAKTKNSTERAMLNTAYAHAQLLLQESKQT